MPLLKLESVSRDFDVSRPWLNRVLEREPRRILRAVDGVSFEVSKGETLALVGESGCGKSTVARMIAGLYAPTEGRIEFGGRRLQMIFQDPYASLNPRWRVSKIIGEPMILLEQKKPVAEFLRQVGLSPDDAERYPHEFSGGQRQRISIARALAGEPELLICDEPTSALDVSVQAQILNLMADLQERLGLTYLFISHNLAVVSLIADRVGVMYFGRIVELAPAAALFTRPRHPYTRMLLDALPDLGMTGKPRTPVAGEVPNPLAPPSGCAFHPRCPYANERCRVEIPRFSGGVACHAVEEGRI
ncbi:MAG TPA: oligopeptide/dipeptide ABC transporter ATP-binding protein [Burkholderiales bacterium]|nr:oligopeptide/dipeptide ABC transporter ATP-binding protein [Burkholderiales bacterium]